MDGAAARTRGITWVAIVVVVAVLYFAQEVFIPFALALLLSFLLGPLAGWLRHLHLGRVPAAVITVALAGIVIGALATFLSFQAVDIAKQLPKYKHTIVAKLKSIQLPKGGVISETIELVRDTGKEIGFDPKTNAVSSPQAQAGGAVPEKPVPVEIRTPSNQPMKVAQQLLGTVLSPILTAGIVTVFILFMLIYKEDLRDRLLRLVGLAQIHVTTQALNDAAARVSRYLLMQLVVNVTYGIPAGIGLYFIGVPNPVLWGMLATLVRFIPYLGPVIGVTLPMLLAFAVDPGWSMVLWTLGLFLTLELISNNLVEPMLYGSSTGLSPVAIILGAVFWTWLWGPVGLLMATPLTACLVVIGRHFPQMAIFNVLFGEEPVLSPETQFYQRLLSRNPEEPADLAEEMLKEKPLVEFYETVLLPALSLAEVDRQRGSLSDAQQQAICRNARDLVDDLADHEEETAEPEHRDVPHHCPIICIPSRSGPDELVSLVLSQLLQRRGLQARVLSADALTSEWVNELQNSDTNVVCISTLAPTAFRHVRYRYRRLRNTCGRPRIFVHVAGKTEETVRLRDQLELRPSDTLITGLSEAITQLSAAAVTTPANSSTEQDKSVPQLVPTR